MSHSLPRRSRPEPAHSRCARRTAEATTPRQRTAARARPPARRAAPPKPAATSSAGTRWQQGAQAPNREDPSALPAAAVAGHQPPTRRLHLAGGTGFQRLGSRWWAHPRRRADGLRFGGAAERLEHLFHGRQAADVSIDRAHRLGGRMQAAGPSCPMARQRGRSLPRRSSHQTLDLLGRKASVHDASTVLARRTPGSAASLASRPQNFPPQTTTRRQWLPPRRATRSQQQPWRQA